MNKGWQIALVSWMGWTCAASESSGPESPTSNDETSNLGRRAKPLSEAVKASAPEACRDYLNDSESFAYCMMEQVVFFTSLEDAASHCELAGEGASQCRHRWVSVQRANPDGYSREELMAFCGDNADCAFELLEFRPHENMEEQIQLCQAHTAEHVENCVGHAIQAWWLAGVSEESFRSTAEMASPYPEKMGYFLAASVVCSDPPVGDCQWAHPSVIAHCERHEDAMTRKPETCPSSVKNPMHGENPENFTDRGTPLAVEQGPTDETRVNGGEPDAIPPPEPRPLDPGPQSGPYDEASGSPTPQGVPQAPPPQPDPNSVDIGGGIPLPDPRMHGHVPDGTPGGGANPPPPNIE